MPTYNPPRLLADIGATFARFAVEQVAGQFDQISVFRCADHVDLYSAISAYMAALPNGRIEHAAVAIGNPVSGDEVRMTNNSWSFSIEQMRQRLGLDTLVVVNDFTALAMAIPRLSPEQRRQVGGGEVQPRSVVGLIGPGSGLGVSGLIPANDGWVALGAEGGHASFSPRDEREILVLRHAARKFGHVSFERLLSGPGLELIHTALAEHAAAGHSTPVALRAQEISRRALEEADALCIESLNMFCAILGTAAANLAVTQGAFGGIFIGGAIVPRLSGFFDRSPFRKRFEDKGRFSDYCKRIPTFVINAENATLAGASTILSQQLRGLESSQGSSLFGQIQRSLNNLSPAERRVADYMLAHPRSAMNDPIAQIALAAEVSQPTVIRFCRSLGCVGLSDFKLRLASGLTGTIPLTHVQVTTEDTMLELGVKVLGNTASAILQMRGQLNRDTVDHAIDLIDAAERLEFYGTGHFAMVAQDAQLKMLRLGVPSMAYVETRAQKFASNLVRPGVVVVIISSTGRVPELLEVAENARLRGAKVVAVTSSLSPLARKADVALIVDHAEDVATQVPMIGRILYLLMIDILAVGVALQRGVDALDAFGEGAAARSPSGRHGFDPADNPTSPFTHLAGPRQAGPL